MNKFLSLAYGSLCYLLFLVTFLVLLVFVGDLLLRKTIDSGYTGSWAGPLHYLLLPG